VRIHASYFAANPGLWTHGDLIERTDRGGWVLHGRSDAVLNVRGIRVGTAEIYAILEDMPEIAEAMAVEQQAEEEPGGSRMLLLVTLRPGLALDAGLTRRIRSELARRGSPALVPSRVLQVGALPVTHSGKRSEAAARDAVNGRAARNRDALRNPDCLDAIAASAAGQDAPAAPAAPAAGPSAEAGLQAICERVLGIAPISPSDNLLELGMDSLAAMSLLLEIERQTGRGLPVSALAEAPSIEGLVRLLNSAEAAPDRQQPQVRHITAAQQPQVRRITAADVEPVCRLLEQGFAEARIPAATWRRLLTHGWDGVAEERGFVLAAGEEILGFLGTIHARRQGAEAGLVCNLSSWYVRPEHRGRGLSMLLAATRDVGRTYTSFTPSPLTRQVLAELGFAPLDTCQLFMPPLLHATTLRYPRPRIEFEPAAVRPLLDAAQRRTFDDHAPYDCLQGVVRDAKAQAYLVVKRRMRELPGRARRAVPARIPYSEVLHCSAPEVLARHLERVKLAVLRRQRTFALVADARLWPEPPAGLRLAARTYARSPVLAAGEIDKLYSELVLLPI
jgi:acetoacetyl-CoA synthetase